MRSAGEHGNKVLNRAGADHGDTFRRQCRLIVESVRKSRNANKQDNLSGQDNMLRYKMDEQSLLGAILA